MTDNIRVIVYSSGLTMAAQATDQAIDREGMEFSTYYPGGLYGTCSFFIPTAFIGSTEFRQGRRVAVYSGIKMIWEGEIDSVVYTATRGTEGIKVNCTGKWGTVLHRMRWDKVWCDTRITDDKWAWTITAAGQENKYRIDRYNGGLRIYPVEAGFTAYDDCSVVYTIPAGQTINRVEATVILNEGTQAWVMELNDLTGGTNIVTYNTSGTSTMSGTPGAGCGSVAIKFYNSATLTADYDNNIYLSASGIKVYGEAGTPTITEIVKDIRNQLSVDGVVAIDETLIGTNSQVIEPCYMEGETYAEFLSRLVSFGDTSLNPWAVGIDASQNSAVPDYLPMIYLEQQPSLTDYEYKLRLEDIENGIKIEQPYYEVYNYVTYEYTDIAGNTVRITPEDDANLTDADSVSVYGRRDAYLKLGNVGTTEADNYARRYLDWFREPHPRMTSPIQVKGYIRTKSNMLVPVHEVRAGKRVLIENYLQEIGGAGLVFIITETRYNEDTGVLTISSGSPEPLEVVTARRRNIV